MQKRLLRIYFTWPVWSERKSLEPVFLNLMLSLDFFCVYHVWYSLLFIIDCSRTLFTRINTFSPGWNQHITCTYLLIPEVWAGDSNLPEDCVVCRVADVDVRESRHLRQHIEDALLLTQTLHIHWHLRIKLCTAIDTIDSTVALTTLSLIPRCHWHSEVKNLNR